MHRILQYLSGLGATLEAWGPWGIFLLAFIDSAGIPVSLGMDAMVVLLGVKAPQSVWFGATMAVIGSVAGNMALFMAARKGGRRFVAPVPEPGDEGKFRGWFRRYGLATVFIPALVPIPLPLKVFVVSAGVLHTPVLEFLTVIVVARVMRYFGEAYLGLMLGERSAQVLREQAWNLTGGALVLFIVIYLVLWLNARRRVRS